MFVAATEGVKADGIDLRMDGAKLDRYRANPVILFGHNSWGRDNLPIGRAPNVVIDGSRLLSNVVEFDPGDDFAVKVERKLRNGFLNAVSIGFEVHAWEKPGQNYWNGGVAVTWELLEISVVPVPMDHDAIMESGRGMNGMPFDRKYLDDLVRTQVDEKFAEHLKAIEKEPVRHSFPDRDSAQKLVDSFAFGGN
jgi:hypothetical protein